MIVKERRGALLAAAVLALGMSGCSTTEQTAADADGPTAREAAVAFAECMRENGIDMADPDSSGMVRIEPELQEQAGFADAQRECSHLLSDAAPVDGDGGMPTDMREQMLELAQCMRDAGYDFPDPDFSGGGAVIGIGEGGVDPSDPDVRAAMAQCQQQVGLPQPGGTQ
jgi:hypothetical protein